MSDITESRKPPLATTGILGWLRMNLFSNWLNSLISFFMNIYNKSIQFKEK